MNNTLKTFIALLAIMAFLAGCSSTKEKPPADDTASVEETPTDSMATEDVEDTSEELEPVDTVFYFEFDQALLRSEARAALTVHAERLKTSPRSVRLEGHADERGSREYNMALGERRANAVRDFLILQGVDSSLLETVSYGEERPAELGAYESAWSKNRRVEMQ